VKQTATICLGESGIEVGALSYEARGNRRGASFAYAPEWLDSPDRFALSPDLPLVPGYQYHPSKPSSSSVFFGCLADVEPDGWGRMVIERDHAKQRREDGAGQLRAGPLTEFDYLAWVSDVSRLGALRLRDDKGVFLRQSGKRDTPPLILLPQLVHATQAVERNTETENDLAFLRGDGSPLGGLRPKCSVVDADGSLALGKFPSVRDTRSVVHGEVLALRLAQAAGIDASRARVEDAQGVSVAVITRFDRKDGKRLMYLSARSLMQAAPDQQYTYIDIAETIRQSSSQAGRDLEELWRRMIFNILINNIDDHLNNHGFLHVAYDQWRLAPAFDLNPFPDKARTLKTWISREAGDAASIADALKVAPIFGLAASARRVLDEVRGAVAAWKTVAKDLGMTSVDIRHYESAFAHPQL
jgi:serine/threonine-protein kinase HipA